MLSYHTSAITKGSIFDSTNESTISQDMAQVASQFWFYLKLRHQMISGGNIHVMKCMKYGVEKYESLEKNLTLWHCYTLLDCLFMLRTE